MNFPPDPDLRVQWPQDDLEAYAVALNPAPESQSERLRRIYERHAKTEPFVANYSRICCFLEPRHHHLPSLLAILSENVHRQYKVGILHPITMHDHTIASLYTILSNLKLENTVMLHGLMKKYDKCDKPTSDDVSFVLSLEPSFEGCDVEYDWLYVMTCKDVLVRYGRTEAELRAKHTVSRLGERILAAYNGQPPKLKRTRYY
jgi:hypothetical protein